MAENSGKEIYVRIPMLQDMEIAATRVAEALAETMHFDEEKIAEVSMALLEACINAFEHSKSPEGKIHITFDIAGDQMKIILRDYGQGFDPDKVEKPDIKKKLRPGTRKRGWGLKLMESLMDSVDIYSDPKGTVVTMVKKK